MKKLRKLETRQNRNGTLISWAIFWCDACKQEVEMNLSNGLKAKFCGCNTHGETRTRLYRIWANMKQRILDFNTKNYKDYGGRGITICDEWLSFIPFRDWSLSHGYTDNLTIDRKENEGNYEPSNCQWLTSKENSQKRRTSKVTQEIVNEIRELDKTGLYTQRELAEKYRMSQTNISNIINNKRW